MLAHSITVVQLRGLPPAAPQLIASIASKANRANRKLDFHRVLWDESRHKQQPRDRGAV
jgi:hypothetical protein